MDKRYFLMILILIVGFINLFIIASNSDIVGSANVECGKYICAVPSGFSLSELKDDEISLHDFDDNMSIYIDSNLKTSDNYNSRQAFLNNDSRYAILSNGSIESNGIEINSIYYTNIEGNRNYSVYYFTKFNNSFKILITEFDYNSQRDYTINILSEIVDSLRENHRM